MVFLRLSKHHIGELGDQLYERAYVFINQAIADCTGVKYENKTEANNVINLDELRKLSHNKKHYLSLLVMSAFAIPLFSLFLFYRENLSLNLVGYLILVFVIMEVAALCCRRIPSEFDSIVVEPLPLNDYKTIRLAAIKDYSIFSYLESVRDQNRILYLADLERMKLI